MNRDDAEEYTQSLGQIVGGAWRQIAWADRQGIPEALGLTTTEWVNGRLGGYVQLAVAERREASKELTAPAEEGGWGMTQDDAAEVLGVAQGTISKDLSGKDYSQEYPEPAEEPVTCDDAPEYYSQEYPEPEPPAPGPQVNDGDEWYTPRWLFDALGLKFSVDVCAPLDQTHSSVPAVRHLTVEHDGLSQQWEGTVWCNPPYSKPEPWARRMIHHGDGLLLVHMPMNAGWCVDLWEACDGIRLFQAMEFVRPDGTSQRPGYWLQLAAFGPVSVAALGRLQPLGDAAANKRRIASPMWRRS